MKRFKHIIALLLVFVLTFSTTSTNSEAAAKNAVKSVKITNVTSDTLALKLNKTFQLKVKVSTTGKAKKQVTYSSSNQNVVSVSENGLITAKKKGTAKITVKSVFNTNKKATLKVIVGTPIKSLQLDRKKATAYVGDKVTVNASIKPANASVQDLVYTSSNTRVATVNGNGVVTCIKPGSTTITVFTNDGSDLEATCTVTVKKKKKPETNNPEEENKTEDVTKPEDITKPEEEKSPEESKQEESNQVDQGGSNYPSYPSTPSTPAPTYELVWEDNFDGTSLNTNDWNYEIHEPGWVNNELQEYVISDDNIYLQDGALVIKPIKHVDGNTVTYTSGRINTQNKHDFKYGYFEVRAKVPTGKGYLPAFWMMPTNENVYGQWPRCGEIDIMEVKGDNIQTAYGTIHYGNPHDQSQGTYKLQNGDFSNEYHSFGVNWEPGKITWYIDGIKYHEENDWYSTTEGQGTVSYPAPFDQPFYLILNLAVGGSWVGYPDETTDFDNQTFMIDYVRAYRKTAGYNENVTKPEKEEVVLRDPDSTGNYIINGTFATPDDLSGAQNWQFMTANNGVATAEIVDDPTFGENAKAVKISTTSAGDVDYSVQFVQPNLPFAKGSKYKVSFDAYAAEARTMIVDISAPDHNYTRYFSDTLVQLTTEKQTFSYDFNMESENDHNGRLEFNLGNTSPIGDVFISNVRVEKTGTFEIDDSKHVLADGNHVYNGSFQEGANRYENWEVVDPGQRSTYSVTDLSDGRRFMLSSSNCTTANDVLLKQTDLPLAANSKYQLSFDAAITDGTNTTLNVNIAGLSQQFTLSTESQNYTYVFETEDTLAMKDITFSLGMNGTILLDNIRVDEYSLIKNGSFNAGLAGFEVYAYTPSNVQYTVDSISEDNAFDITIKDTGDQDWHIQLKQNNVVLEKDQWYTLEFDIKSSNSRKVMYAIQRDGSSDNVWTPYVQEVVDTTDSYTHISKTFQMNCDTDLKSILTFSMGAVNGIQINTQHRICIDNVTLDKVEAPSLPSVPANQEMFRDPTFSDAQVTEWDAAVNAPGAATPSFVGNKAIFDITNVGEQDWHVQLKQSNLTLENGATYKLKFNATSSVPRKIKWAMTNPAAGYDYYGGEDLSVGTDTLTVDTQFTVSKATATTVQFVVSMGLIDGDPASVVTLSDFSLMKIEPQQTPTIQPVPANTEMLIDNTFSANPVTAWEAAVTAPGAATTSFADNKATFDISNVGSEDWNIQLKQSNLTLEKGCTYTMKFKATSDVSRKIKWALLNPNKGYEYYGGEDDLSVSPEGLVVNKEFTVSNASCDTVQLVVSMGCVDNDSASVVTLSDFSLMKNPSNDN